MSKVILVTGSADENLVSSYASFPMIGVEKGNEILLKQNLKPFYALGDFDSYNRENIAKILPSEKIITLKQEKDESDTEAALKFAINHLGASEIVILASLYGRYDHSHALLLLLRKYRKIHLQIEDAHNRILYFEKGNHIISQEEYPYIGLFGFPNAVVTMENTKYPVKKMKLSFCEVKAISNVIQSRVSLFTVHKGSVLVVLSRDKGV